MTTDVKAAAGTSFGKVKFLVGLYVLISLGTLVAIFLMRNNHDNVNSAVWIRGTIVAVTSLLMASFVRRAAGGSSRAFLRLRLVSGIMVIAIIVIISLPGTFPVWMKVEQGVCGLVLLFVVLLVNSKSMRQRFAG